MAGRIGAVGRTVGRVGRRGEVGWLKHSAPPGHRWEAVTQNGSRVVLNRESITMLVRL
jgi:hypothetical protein